MFCNRWMNESIQVEFPIIFISKIMAVLSLLIFADVVYSKRLHSIESSRHLECNTFGGRVCSKQPAEVSLPIPYPTYTFITVSWQNIALNMHKRSSFVPSVDSMEWKKEEKKTHNGVCVCVLKRTLNMDWVHNNTTKLNRLPHKFRMSFFSF